MPAREGSVKRIAVIPGDGVGKEVIPESVKILKAAAAKGGRELSLTEFDWGADRFLRDGTTLPADAVEVFRHDFDAILLGAMGDTRVPDNRHAADILLGLRFKLDLYANVRPCVLFDSKLTPLENRTEKEIDFYVIRENTEGLYAGVGGFFKKGTADEIATQGDVNTRKGVDGCFPQRGGGLFRYRLEPHVYRQSTAADGARPFAVPGDRHVQFVWGYC